ncbi:MAG TPA: DUF1460 domain-containing protein [bacterium]|mgnify:CR=1 FL=1|nr:DUF1460 domain-containing protein [bacterium]HPN31207.1 DUF1460 domain-containing protein [bacterium]
MIFSNLKNVTFIKKNEPVFKNEIGEYLDKLNHLDKKSKLVKIVLDYIDNPYKSNPLIRESDNFPSLSLFYQDCSVFVANSLALSESENYSEFIKNYSEFFYYSGGEIAFDRRIHFTEDRILTSLKYPLYLPVEFKSIEENLTCVLNKKKNGEKLLNIDFEKKIVLKLIPAAHIAAITDFIKLNNQILGAAFVRKKNDDNGHLISHEGFLVETELFHASKDSGKVCRISDFAAYFKNCKFDGAVFFKTVI